MSTRVAQPASPARLDSTRRSGPATAAPEPQPERGALSTEELARRTGFDSTASERAGRSGQPFDRSSERAGLLNLLGNRTAADSAPALDAAPAAPLDALATRALVEASPELRAFFASELQDPDPAFFGELADAVFYDEQRPFDLSYPDRDRALLDATWSALRGQLPVAAPGTRRPEPGQERALDGPRAVQQLEAVPGFASLAPGPQAQLRALVGGSTALSAHARQALVTLLGQPDFSAASPARQAAQLRALQEQPGGLPAIVDPAPREAAPYALQALPPARDDGDDRAMPPRRRFAVRVGEHQVQVEAPLQPGSASLPTDQAVAEALARMPAEALRNIERVVLHADNNALDGIIGMVYGIDGLQSAMRYSGSHQVEVYAAADDGARTMASMLTHEAGHAEHSAHFGLLRGSWRPWQNAMASDAFAASRYARSNKVEDFAETFALYARHRGTPAHDELRAVFPARFALLDRLLNR